MKATNLIHLASTVLLFLVFCLFLYPQPTQAQGSSDYIDSFEAYSQEELAQMLAPIALYPDALLSQVLMASTYPIEVIEADRWLKNQPQLTGDVLDAALLRENWDPSVKALCHFPAILALMSERIGETTNLGNAFLAQEDRVMDMVQELRTKAYAQSNLTTTDKQKVIVERDTIIIEPADPRIIYVPYYDPYVVYGTWWYPHYPPYYWGPATVNIGFGISYWPGFYLSFSFGSWSHFDWHQHRVYIDAHKRPRYVGSDRWHKKSAHWQHLPEHRRGVAYRDKVTAGRFGQTPYRSSQIKRGTRGFPDGHDWERQLNSDRYRYPVDSDRSDRNKLASPKRPEPDRRLSNRSEGERSPSESAKKKQSRIKAEARDQTRIGTADLKRNRSKPTIPARIRPEATVRKQALEAAARNDRQSYNIFNRVDEGRQERLSSERGRGSRRDKSSGKVGGIRSEREHEDRGRYRH
ncbi:MAG: DUF3300 domain-containing protein [Desulfuromonadaceae bacterium]